MKLRDIVFEATNNLSLDDYLKNFPELNYEVRIVENNKGNGPPRTENIQKVNPVPEEGLVLLYD